MKLNMRYLVFFIVAIFSVLGTTAQEDGSIQAKMIVNGYFFLTSSLRHPKFVGEQGCYALMSSHGHGPGDFLPIRHLDGNGCYRLGHVENLVNTHANVGTLE